MFDRERTRHRFTAREATVTAVSTVGPYVRVTLSGPDFADFVSDGPTDHARVFFPHPVTGELLAPVAVPTATPPAADASGGASGRVGPGEEGVIRPDGPTFGRDFTPLNVRAEHETRAFDLDILRHADAGPAAAWGERAQVGDRLVVVGPRGSARAPQDAARALLVVDGTALPAASRFIEQFPAATSVDVLVYGDLTAEIAETYLGATARVFEALGDVVEEARDLVPDAETFVFAAGEASVLAPLRRYLRRELGLPAEQVAMSGYWRRGVVAWDHHAPIDPYDPD